VVARPGALSSDDPTFGLVADAEFILVPEMASAVNRAYMPKRRLQPF